MAAAMPTERERGDGKGECSADLDERKREAPHFCVGFVGNFI